MSVDRFVKDLAKELDIEGGIQQETEGVYTLFTEEGTQVTISDFDGGVGFHAAIDTYPEKNEERFLTEAMLANLFGQGTEGGILGLDEEGKILTLATEYPKCDTYKAFQEHLEDFLNAVDYWRDEINEQKGE